ncbi:MAG: cation transporter [Methanosarcina barkeri]|nr:cation transporter [Methanosarcina sp. ERenArc_MAG2]
MKLAKAGTKSFQKEYPYAHTHGVADLELLSTSKGLYAVKWSFAGLIATAFFQILVFRVSGSISLLADIIHNFRGASTVILLNFAFLLSRKKSNKRFTYGYGRAEDLQVCQLSP